MATLSIKRILVGALASVVTQAKPLATALMIPATVFIVLFLVPVQGDENNPPNMLLVFGQGVVSIVLHTLFAITTHRIVVLGPDSVPRWGIRQWRQRESRFALYLIGSAMAVLLMVPFAAALMPIGPVLLMAGIFVLGSAVGLMFPAIALEHDLTLRDAWQLARPNLLVLVVCIWLFPFLLAIPTVALMLSPYSAPLAAVLQVLTTVLTIATLSIAYTEIRRNASHT